MSDEISEISSKVINIFQRHRRGEHFHFDVGEDGEMVISPDGFNYVSIKQERNGHNSENTLLEMASRRHYIVKMMESHHENGVTRLNNYYVPGDRLQDFMLSLSNRPGRILEIKPFIPDHMA